MDSDASVMEGNDIEDLGGGSFRTVAAVSATAGSISTRWVSSAESQVPDVLLRREPVERRCRRGSARTTPHGGHLQRHEARRAASRTSSPSMGAREPVAEQTSACPQPGVHLRALERPHARSRAGRQDRPASAAQWANLLRSAPTGTRAIESGCGRRRESALRISCRHVLHPADSPGAARRGTALVSPSVPAQTARSPARDRRSRRGASHGPSSRSSPRRSAQHRLPGAVVLAGAPIARCTRRHSESMRVVPSREAMTTDTIFDVASLTKVVATTTAVMMLLEQGRLGLDERVATYIPEFGRYGKQRITIRHLLTHTSGLRADLDLADVPGRAEAIRLATEEVPVAAPGARLIYSDINFFLLGEIVARMSGERLDVFCADAIFEPLGMRDTTFLPPASLPEPIAPTRSLCAARVAVRRPARDDAARRRARSDGATHGRRGRACRAVQHGRRSRVFCRMLLNGGTWTGARALAADRCADDAAGHAAGMGQVRGLGWDIDSPFAVQPRCALPDRLLRSHRVDRDVAVDRSGDAHVRRVPREPGAPRRQGRRGGAARARRYRRGGGARRGRRVRATAPMRRATSAHVGRGAAADRRCPC